MWDGRLFLQFCNEDEGKLLCLDATTGEDLWQADHNKGTSWSTPVVTEDAVYIGGISASPYYFEGVKLEAGLYAVERETGEMKWRMTPDPIEGYITGGVFSSPVVVDAVLYVAGLDGYLYALRR